MHNQKPVHFLKHVFISIVLFLSADFFLYFRIYEKFIIHSDLSKAASWKRLTEEFLNASLPSVEKIKVRLQFCDLFVYFMISNLIIVSLPLLIFKCSPCLSVVHWLVQNLLDTHLHMPIKWEWFVMKQHILA